MKIHVIERRPVTVACLSYAGPAGEPLRRYWRITVVPWLAEHGLVDCPRYGVVLDGTAANQLRYHACVELPAGLTLPGAEQTPIAGGHYAMTPFKGTGAQIAAAWETFIAAVRADPAQRIDAARHAFEHYPRGAAQDAKSGVFACELCLPVESLP